VVLAGYDMQPGTQSPCVGTRTVGPRFNRSKVEERGAVDCIRTDIDGSFSASLHSCCYSFEVVVVDQIAAIVDIRDAYRAEQLVR
jgi:hypothetical protein